MSLNVWPDFYDYILPHLAGGVPSTALLASTTRNAANWTQLPDVSDASRSAWAVCRQALRDVTMQPGPMAIVWPDPPA